VDNDRLQGFGALVSGVVGTLFTLATVILVYLTYNSQKEELEKTTKALYKQNFESTFLMLLNMRNKITEKIQKDFYLKTLYDLIQKSIDKFTDQMHPGDGSPFNPEEYMEDVKAHKYHLSEPLKIFVEQELNNSEVRRIIIPYIENLSSILKYLENSEDKLIEGDKQVYLHLIKRNLLPQEPIFIYYLCLSDSYPLFKRLIKKYILIDKSLLDANMLFHSSFYDFYDALEITPPYK
jgi:hypothetical protein